MTCQRGHRDRNPKVQIEPAHVLHITFSLKEKTVLLTVTGTGSLKPDPIQNFFPDSLKKERIRITDLTRHPGLKDRRKKFNFHAKYFSKIILKSLLPNETAFFLTPYIRKLLLVEIRTLSFRQARSGSARLAG